MTPQRYHAALKQMIKRSIVIMDAMGDIDSRFRYSGQIWNRVVDDGWLAYGQNETRVRIVPTSREIAQAEIVGDWLLWLGRAHGGVPLLVSWARDVPIWRLAERERVSERCIHSRIDRSVGRILTEFGAMDAEIPEIEERAAPPHSPFFVVTKPTIGPDAPVGQHGKCWIDGVGFMRHGKRLNNGRSRISDRIMANGD